MLIIRRLLRLFLLVLSLALLSTMPQRVLAWSAEALPTSYAQFVSGTNYPYQMFFDNSGNLFAAAGGDNITKYDSSGNVLLTLGQAFSSPTGVTIDSLGKILVGNYLGDVIDIYSSAGVYETSFGSSGTGNGQFNGPYSLDVDSLGFIYIADAYNNRIQKYDSSYSYVSTITGNGSAFNFPEAIAVDSQDNLYVLDSGNNRVQVFDSSGTYVRTTTGNGSDWNYPEGMTVDSYDNLYVSDSGNYRIQAFDSTGTYQAQYGSAGAPLGQFSYPTGLAMDAAGSLYIGDNTRIQKFIFDRLAPSVTITSLAGDSTTDTTPSFTGTVTDTEGLLSTIEYAIDGGAYAACTADDGTIDELSETYTCTVASDLALGAHTVVVRSNDVSGNQGTDSYSFSVASTPSSTPTPTTTSSSNPSSDSTPAAPAPSPGSFPIIYKYEATERSITIYFLPGVGPLTHYLLEYSRYDDRFEYGVNPLGSNESQVFTVSALLPDTTYYFRLSAVNIGTVGTPSLVFSGRTKAASTSLPTVAQVDEPESATPPPVSTLPSPVASVTSLISDFKSSNDNPLNRIDTQGLILSAKTSVAVGAGAIGTFAVVESLSYLLLIFRTLTDIFQLTGRKWYLLPFDVTRALGHWLFVALGFGWRSMPQAGITFDAIRDVPLSGVFVVLFSPSGNLATSFTDAKGQYYLRPVPDSYQLRAEKSGYTFPSKQKGLRSTNLYAVGQTIEVVDKDTIVSDYSLALDPHSVKSSGLRVIYRIVVRYIYLPLTVITAFFAPTLFNIVIAVVLSAYLIIRRKR